MVGPLLDELLGLSDGVLEGSSEGLGEAKGLCEGMLEGALEALGELLGLFDGALEGSSEGWYKRMLLREHVPLPTVWFRFVHLIPNRMFPPGVSLHGTHSRSHYIPARVRDRKGCSPW